jgi:hypothetical protein
MKRQVIKRGKQVRGYLQPKECRVRDRLEIWKGQAQNRCSHPTDYNGWVKLGYAKEVSKQGTLTY